MPGWSKKREQGGKYDKYVGACRFFNENMVCRSQLAAAVCPAKLTPEMEVAPLWWW